MTKKYVWTIIVIVIVLIAGWLVFRGPATSTPAPSAQSNTPYGNAANATTTTQVVTPVTTPAKTGTTQTPQQVVVTPGSSAISPSTVTAPASGAQWVFGQKNTIQWSKAANVTGAIYLVNAQNGSIVGWILEQAGPKQTSYSWNTQDLFVGRTSPTGITVSVGTYAVKVMFDSPQIPTITSAPFSIIAPNQVQIPTHNVTITNSVFTPSSLTVKRGDKIVFANNDAATYSILVSNFSPFSVIAGGVYTFDTTPISPGPYTFYTSAYPSLRMNVTVQ